jgi:hypothetical protein
MLRQLIKDMVKVIRNMTDDEQDPISRNTIVNGDVVVDLLEMPG